MPIPDGTHYVLDGRYAIIYQWEGDRYTAHIYKRSIRTGDYTIKVTKWWSLDRAKLRERVNKWVVSMTRKGHDEN